MAANKKNTTPLMPTEMLESIIESLPDPLLLYRLRSDHSPGQIVFCNKKALEITGYSRSEILNLSFTDLGHPDSGLVDASMADILLKGEPVLFERIIVRKDKTSFPVEVNGQQIEYQGEKMILSILRDISKRKKSEEENHLHLMFEKIVSNISSRFVKMPDNQINNGIKNTLREICEFIGAIRGRIFLFDDKHENLLITHEWCVDKDLCQKAQSQNYHIERFIYLNKKLNELEDVIIDSEEDLPPDASAERKWFDENGFLPIFYVPIISEEEVVGVLGFTAENNKTHQWPRQYGHLLRYIGNIFFNTINRRDISWKLRRTQFTLDHYSDSVFWLSVPDFNIIDVNPAGCLLLGYTREELLEMTVFDFDPIFANADLDKLWKVIRQESSNRQESVHQNKNGDQFPVEILSYLIDFEGDESIVSFTRDITAQKQAEEQLKQSEQEYRKIFENVAYVFYEASLEGILLNITPSVERMTNYTQKDLIGKPMEVFYYDPSVREPLLKALYEKGEILDFEIDVKDLDGKPIPASLNSKIIFDEAGKPERIVGSLSELRKRREAETQVRQLSTALEQSPVSVIITDPDSQILYVNKNFIDFSGLHPDKIIGSTPGDLTPDKLSLDELWKTLKKGKVWKGELDYLKRDGSHVWLSVTASPLRDNQDQLINFVGILEEISERKASEQNLRKAKEQAEKSDHLKSAFLANMSHEIRTPMNAILGFSALLKEGDMNEEQSDYYIDIINSKGRDLLRIISDIIDISRIEAGDLYIKMEPVEIFPFVRDIFKEFKEDTQVRSRSNLQFRLNIPDPEKKVIVNTDPSRLKQVFVNLIQNALKFTPDGFVEVGFHLNDKHDIIFTVKDSGIGIPEDKKRIIFERFRQIDDSHTREYGGTGLGLSICKNLLDLMGSKLSLGSEKGQGSEFTFRMKYILTESKGTGLKYDDSKLPEIKLDLQGKIILIVEDDGSSYLFLETFLNRYSPEIIWAKNGKQAIDIMKRKKDIDLILMDIRMPEMDGLKATRHIRKINKNIPIIAQTAYAQVTDRKLALESGCSDYLSKPVSPPDLIALLAKYLNPDA
jgi:PAS domain S-box-containing protein